jgi:hypothetical protein
MYYVYAYLRPDGTPYYIGKGKDNRVYANHRVKVPADESKIKIIAHKLSEYESFLLETRLIKQYGRKDLGTGILRNLTDGGEGASGWVMPQYVKEKISSIKQGQTPWNLGKEHSQSAKEKMANAWKKRAPVSDETKRKLSEAHKNKSPEVLAKYKAAARNRPPMSEATKAKIGKANSGRKLSEETKAKISAAKKLNR